MAAGVLVGENRFKEGARLAQGRVEVPKKFSTSVTYFEACGQEAPIPNAIAPILRRRGCRYCNLHTHRCMIKHVREVMQSSV